MDEYPTLPDYGILRWDTAMQVQRFRVSPTDMAMIQLWFREDWDRINDFIQSNVRGMRRHFHYPLARR